MKRLASLFLLLFLALFTSISYAEDQVSAASNDLLYVCDTTVSYVSLGAPSPETEKDFSMQSQLGRHTERISTNELIQYSREDKGGSKFRTGSKTLTRKCGAFKLYIKRGFLNSNLNGELGGYEFPYVELSVDKKTTPLKISIGSCESKVARYNYLSDCPTNWAVKIQALFSDQLPIVSLVHTYEEIREFP